MKNTEKRKQGFVEDIEPVTPRRASRETVSTLFEEEIRCLLGGPPADREMEDLDDPATRIVDGLNNALTTVTGYAEMSMFEIGEGTTVHYYQKQILGAARRASHLASQLVAIGRGGDEDETEHPPGFPDDITGGSDPGADERK